MENEVLKAIKERRSIRRFKADQITDEELKTVLEAGTWAATGHGTQEPFIIAVQNPEICAQLRKMNAEIMGVESDPYYGAPTIVIVLAPESNVNGVKDGSLILGNMMLHMTTNLGGKLSFSVELEKAEDVAVEIVKA